MFISLWELPRRHMFSISRWALAMTRDATEIGASPRKQTNQLWPMSVINEANMTKGLSPTIFFSHFIYGFWHFTGAKQENVKSHPAPKAKLVASTLLPQSRVLCINPTTCLMSLAAPFTVPCCYTSFHPPFTDQQHWASRGVSSFSTDASSHSIFYSRGIKHTAPSSGPSAGPGSELTQPSPMDRARTRTAHLTTMGTVLHTMPDPASPGPALHMAGITCDTVPDQLPGAHCSTAWQR